MSQQQQVKIRIENETDCFVTIANSKLVTVLDEIKPNWRQKIIAVQVNDSFEDIASYIINEDISLKLIDQDSPIGLQILNYSTGFILALGLQRSDLQCVIANIGFKDHDFFVDFDSKTRIKEQDLLKLQELMQSLISSGLNFKKELKLLSDLKVLFANNPYVLEQFTMMIKNDKIAVYNFEQFNFINRYVLLDNLKMIQHFALLSVSGVYWNDDAKNVQIQRIYGISAFTADKLNERLSQLTLQKAMDHRTIGRELEIFLFDNLAGQGLPIWLPNGMIIKKQLQEYLRNVEFLDSYLEVATPVMGSIDLYKTSGHWDHYQKNMFPILNLPHEQLLLRPMSCPHHCLVYRHKLRSYRDLPLRFSEHELLFRYESSGALTGLERVRAMELTDAHIFCRLDQVKTEFKAIFKLITKVLTTLKIEIDYFSLSLRDPEDKEKYYDNDQMWNQAESMLETALQELDIKYLKIIGEAAFYGPKLDIQIKTAIGHEVTISTIQLDFLLPEKFDLSYKNEDGAQVRPIIIHRGLIGTYERFIATLLEQTKGVLPFWLSPQQIAIIPISSEQEPYCYDLERILRGNNIRATVVNGNDSLSYKIRYTQTKKIPFQIVVGKKEIAENMISYRRYAEQKSTMTTLASFISLCQKLIADKN